MRKLIFVLLIFSTLVINAQYREDCIPPKNLTAVLDEELYNTINVRWEQPSYMYYHYDEGGNIDRLGGPDTIFWAIKVDPIQMTMFWESPLLDIVEIFICDITNLTLKIFQGENASTLIYEQELVNLNDWYYNFIILDNPVQIDIEQEFWVVISSFEGANYPAACGYGTGEPNGDFISQDGIAWEHLTDYNLNYTWNLRCHVRDTLGNYMEFGNSNKIAERTQNSVTKSNNLASAERKYPGNREWVGYNLYRDGILVAEEISDNYYLDNNTQPGNIYCYQATSVYSICGESEPSNEGCAGPVIVSEKIKVNLNIYPNPVNDYLRVEGKNISAIHVIDYKGQTKFNKKIDQCSSIKLNTSTYSPGIYIAKIYTEEGMVNRKFIISR